jgi:hypothetical protein
MAYQFQVDTGGTLLTNLQYYARMEADANDVSTNGRSATLTGSPSFASGKVNNRIGITASSTAAKLNSLPGKTQTSTWSVAYWYRIPSSLPVGDEDYMGFIAGAAGNFCTLHRQLANGKHDIYMVRRGQATLAQCVGVTTLSVDTWYHFIITSDGSTLRFYINNTLEDDAAISSTAAADGDEFGVGLNGQGGGLANHTFYADEVGIWSKVLSSTERADLYNSGNGQTMESLVTKTCSDSITVSDVLQKQAGKVLAEASSITDAILRTIQRAFSEAAPITDALTSIRTLPYTASESMPVSDSVVKQTGRPLSESISITDVILRVTSRLFDETIAVTDAILRTTGKVLNEATSIADTLVRTVSRALSETPTVTDSITRVTGRTLGDSFSVTDLVAKVVVHVRTFVESLTITDHIRNLLNGLDARYSRKFPSNPGSYSSKYETKGPTYEKKYPNPQ